MLVSDQADDGGDVVAVVVEIVESPVQHLGTAGHRLREFGTGHVHGGAVDQRLQQFNGYLEAALAVADRHEDGVVGRFAGHYAMQGVEPGIEPEALVVRRELRVIANVVGVAHERVHGAEGIALAPRQHEKCVVEIARRLARNVPAHAVRSTQLQGRSAGRARGLAGLGEDGHR